MEEELTRGGGRSGITNGRGTGVGGDDSTGGGRIAIGPEGR